MITTERRAEARAILDAHRAAGRTIGVVGTSGGTHAGHLSLAYTAKRECDVVVVIWNGGLNVAIGADIVQHYTRDLDRDAKLFEETGVVDLLYVTRGPDLYRRPSLTRVEIPEMQERLGGMPEGAHMDVVVTMVLTLLNIVGPSTMVFGEKDWQQLVMFQRMAEDLLLPSRILGSPTVREDDGLAVSSRNTRLSPAERAAAPELYRALSAAADAVRAGERDARTITDGVRERLRRVAVPEYVTAVEADTLRPLDTLGGEVRLLASATFGSTPLVDNLGITVPEPGGQRREEQR